MSESNEAKMQKLLDDFKDAAKEQFENPAIVGLIADVPANDEGQADTQSLVAGNAQVIGNMLGGALAMDAMGAAMLETSIVLQANKLEEICTYFAQCFASRTDAATLRRLGEICMDEADELDNVGEWPQP